MMSLPWNSKSSEETVGWKILLIDKLIPVTGILTVILLPYFHLGFLYSFWTSPNKLAVDKQKCRCDCWDTLFKGNYELGVGRYKHIYFNLTSKTLVVWAWTVLYGVALYESVCYLLRLYLRGHLRLSMFALFAAALYPHYYAWWMYFNYANDEYYVQWNHQTFFSATEMVSTLMVVYLCDCRRETLPRYMLLIVSVAILHILAASGDQFIRNVIMRRGALFQIFRDIGFMLPDLLNVIIPLFVWLQWCRRNGVAFMKSIERSELGLACLGVLMLLLICSAL